MKLKNKLLCILIPLILAPILAIGAIAYTYLQHTALTAANARLSDLSRQFTTTTRAQLENIEKNLSSLARNTLIQTYFTANEDDRYTLLHKPVTRLLKKHQLTYPAQYEIRILLPNGYEDLRVTNQPYPNKTDDESQSAFFKKLSPDTVEIQNFFYTNVDNNTSSILFSKTISLINNTFDALGTEATFRGYLTMSIAPSFITELADSLSTDFPVELIISDNEGVLRQSTSKELSTQVSYNTINTQVPLNNVSSSLILHNKHYLIYRNKVSKNIRASILVDTETLYQDADNLWKTTMFLSAIIMLISAIVLYIVLSKMIISPIGALISAVKNISQGRVDNLPIIQKRDEIGDLFRAFSEMKQSLRLSNLQIEELAYFDNLTGLPNKVTFFETINRLIEKSETQQHKLAVIFLDLDNFKNINDGLGHQMGDLLLMQVGTRIQHCLRDQDLMSNLSEVYDLQGSQLISRMGGDEFSLILSDLKHSDEAGKVAVRILTQLARPFLLDEHEIFIGASIGIALFPDDGQSPEDLLKYADIAMYEAKNKGKNNYQFFNIEMTEGLEKRISLEAKMRAALGNNEFSLHYQPKVCLNDPSRIEFEALIRWITKEDGFISPADFIPVAEESGLIIKIGDWVLNEACRQTRLWIEQGYSDIRVSINFSPVQINYGNPSNAIRTALAKHHLEPKNIELEITESGLMQNEKAAVAYLNSLKDLGIRIALDDFGTGYSSLAYLQRFPIDTLKIDRAFIKDMEHNLDSQHVLDTIMFLAEKLNLETVAEGVETKQQLAIIQEKGCKIVQGYYFSKPLPPLEAINFFIERIEQITRPPNP